MHFVMTFGFSIPIKSDANVNDESSIKGKVKKKKTRQSKGKKISKSTIEITQASKNIIRVGQILSEIHVEYELLPNYNFKFDCRCWDTATKIYTENDDWCLRPIPCPIKENTCWVIFSIHHVVHLNEAQLRKFVNYVIIYHIFYGRQKFSERAKKDRVKGFFIDDESINKGQEDFLEIHPLDLYQSNSTAKPSITPIPQPATITHEDYGDFSIVTYLDVIPDSIHEYLFRKMSKKERFPPESLKFQLLATSIENKEKSSSQRTKNSTKKRSKRTKRDKRKQGTEKYEIHLPAEVLFSDMGTITSYNRTPQLPNISSILIYAQCQNILSNKQLRKNLNPISIKLEQLSNFPVNTVIEKGFKYLYAKIFFVDRTVVTPFYVPSAIMRFEFVKCFLCEEFQLEKLINFLATKFLAVEIIGVTEQSTPIPDQSDYDKSVEGSISKSAKIKEEVLLGVAEFDVSDLLRGFWEVKLTNSLIHPRNIVATSTDRTTDERMEISWKNSPLTADVLTSHGTSVKIKVRLAYDLRMLQRKVLRRENILNRIFFNLSDSELINDILKDVSSHNSSLISSYQISNESGDLKAKGTLKHVLTGFVIENFERFYIFLEGLSNGYLLKIWEKVSKLPIQHKCIYYNSNYVFVTRLYEDFIPLGGVIHIKLSEPLEMQLRKCSLYIGGTKSLQANLIRKLGLIDLTLTMKSLCQTGLFPESNHVKTFIDNVCKIHLESTVQVIDK